jgi:DNA invertase Pin-like site-specific DNA recombinase
MQNLKTTRIQGREAIMNALKRIALYARVSTSKCEKCGKRLVVHDADDHDYKGQDAEVQLRDLRDYAAARGWIITEVYTDTVTGAKQSRPDLNRLMADAAQRKFDAVLVWKLDRFGRSLRHLVNALAELEALGVSFISLRDNLDLGTPSGRLMFQIIGAMAEFERSLIQERVCAGLRNAKAKGRRLGRPRVVVDKAEIFALRESGASWRTIAGKMGIGVGTVHRIAQARSKNLCGAIPVDNARSQQALSVGCLL